MKRLLVLLTALALLSIATTALAAPKPKPWTPSFAAASATAVDDDPDASAEMLGGMDKETYLRKRGEYFLQRFDNATFEEIYNGRLAAIAQMQLASRQQAAFAPFGTWAPIGPYPIPNGQTTTISTPVSGRVTAIAIHPTNPNIVYIGAAQGGVWRSMDGGATWVAIFDNAASLSIGALALAPTDPTILYVGTGEANGSADSFFGVGLYRIDNADTAPVLNGPFNPTPTTDVIGAQTFTGRSISKILVDPADAATIFVSSTSGIGGLYNEAFGSTPPITSLRGIYRSTNATSGSPSFTKLTVSTAGSIAPDVTGTNPVNDMAYDPTDPTGNTLVCWLNGNGLAGVGGVWRSTNAKAGAPTFGQTFVSTNATARGTFAVNRVAGVTTMYAGTGESAAGTACTTGSGCLRRSLDGGATWSAKLAGGGGYCGGQCFYDLPVAVSPTDANRVLIGGAGNGACSRVFAISTNGAATFTGAGVADVGMHADAHAIEFAPSDPSIVYEGNDGGIWKSTNGGASFVSVNTAGFSATQFQSIAVHPTDPNFTIGGTQDNGTNWYQPSATWVRADFGDGGMTAIDQNAPDNTNVTMYHTYFNQTNAMAYARVTNTASASDGLWTLFGCGFGGSTPNGFTCAASAIQFYAPMTTGPGNPNTLYFGSDVLYRSVDAGVTMVKVSQEPIVSARSIESIAIAPTNDNVRLVGLSNFTVWGTVTGSTTLTNMTGPMPAHSPCRIMIDPTDPNVAYVAFGGFNLGAGNHLWRTGNLMTGTPTWTASGNGLPDVPANAIVIDPALPNRLWVGTDVGVYESTNYGATWAPFTTGMPVVAVFDMKLQPTSRILRCATHGRGMFERSVDAPTATELALVGAEIVDGHPKMTWYSTNGTRMNLYRRAIPGDWMRVREIAPDGTGMVTYEDLDTQPGRSYEYRIGVMDGSTERMLGQVWVDVPAQATFALKRLSPDAGGAVQFAISLPAAGPASLDLIDVTGRRMASVDLTSLGSGDHQVKMDTHGTRAGVYFARLTQANKMLSTRVVLVR